MTTPINQFKLITIPGTEDFAKNELLTKFPEISVIKVVEGNIIFQTDNYKLDDFHRLLASIRIEDAFERCVNLYRRDWRKAFVPAGINPALAYILCDIADLNEKDILLDPFCGGSTIPITALLYFKINKAFASDLSGKAIDVSLENFKNSGISKDRFVLFRSNVSMIKLAPKSITKVITNMPFGIRSGDHEKNLKLYQIFNLKLRSLLAENGLAILLTQEKKLIYEAFGNFKIKLVATIEQGGLKPSIYCLS